MCSGSRPTLWSTAMCFQRCSSMRSLHHTPTEDRVNYGMALAIWDRLFGTFKMPEQRPTRFGLVDSSYARRGLLAQHLDSLGVPVARTHLTRAIAGRTS